MSEPPAAADALQRRWLALCDRLGMDGAGEWDILHSLYNQPERAYHNLRHIADCLCQLDRHIPLAEEPDALEMAIWLHDVIYDPRAADNEAESARHAARFLGDSPLAETVVALIMATRHSEELPGPGDPSLIVDIDLSILGSDPVSYGHYADVIRQEYQHVPDDLYMRGRTAVLEKFLARPRIFTHRVFHQALDAAARDNLAAEIRRLADSGNVRD